MRKEEGMKRMNGKRLVELRIPTEEVGNIDELVSEGYYGNRNDAIRDIIRRGAAQLRTRYWFVETKGDKKMKRDSYTELGMLLGIFVGSGIGVTAFVSTNNALFFTVPGFGVIFGLGIGAMLDKWQKSKWSNL